MLAVQSAEQLTIAKKELTTMHKSNAAGAKCSNSPSLCQLSLQDRQSIVNPIDPLLQSTPSEIASHLRQLPFENTPLTRIKCSKNNLDKCRQRIDKLEITINARLEHCQLDMQDGRVEVNADCGKVLNKDHDKAASSKTNKQDVQKNYLQLLDKEPSPIRSLAGKSL